MQILESAMAFAIAMIIFSTIVTGIVELLMRILGAREKNLQKTIESLYNSVVLPRMKSRLKDGTNTPNDKQNTHSADFVSAMTDNPAHVAITGCIEKIFSTRCANKIDALTPLAFAERLGRTDVGKAILAEGEAQIELLVQDFVRTYNRFGRAASEIYRKKAKQVAIVVGILFALGVNIEAVRLFTALMNNPDLRSGLIAEADNAAKANQEAAASLADVIKKAEEGGLPENQTKEIKAQAAKIDSSIKALQQKGLPIGYNYYPYCQSKPLVDRACEKTNSKWKYAIKFCRWLLLSMIAGVLIGLGGPFWFRVFTSLSQLFQVLRALGVSSKPQQAKPEEVAALPEAENSAKPKDIIDAFKVAAQVHAHGTAAGRRLLLGPDGQPL